MTLRRLTKFGLIGRVDSALQSMGSSNDESDKPQVQLRHGVMKPEMDT